MREHNLYNSLYVHFYYFQLFGIGYYRNSFGIGDLAEIEKPFRYQFPYWPKQKNYFGFGNFIKIVNILVWYILHKYDKNLNFHMVQL